MTVRYLHIFIIIIFSSLFISSTSENKTKLSKNSGKNDVTFTFFTINNISTPIQSNGIFDNTEQTDFNGCGTYFYPKNFMPAGYSSGLLWGGKINGKIRVGGSAYYSTLKSGWFDKNGIFHKARIYRVRKDWEKGDLSSEVSIENLTEDEIRDNYKTDWYEWPAEIGAPFVDQNNNGKYEPEVDLPGIEGADQTIWFIATDRIDYLSFPQTYAHIEDRTNIEIQTTIWGYKNSGSLDNVYFKKYKMTNIGNDTINDVYACQYADQDIVASSDGIGCDTLLNLNYVYSNRLDGRPKFVSVGYQLLSSLSNGKTSEQNLILYHNKIQKHSNQGWKEIDLTSEQDTFYYYLFQSINYNTFEKLVDETTGLTTNYYYPGNPITKTGWYDQELFDKRQGLSVGSFDLEPGSSKEFVYSNVAGDGKSTSEAIIQMKKNAFMAQTHYNNGLSIPKVENKIVINVKRNSDIIKLKWDDNKSAQIEFDGYEFQGYKLFQFSDSTLLSASDTILNTFDKVDGITNIEDFTYDVIADEFVKKVIQTGSDSGLEYSVLIDKDYLLNSKLIKGKKYYFGISAYYYNPTAADGLKLIETTPNLVSISYKAEEYGFNFGDGLKYRRVSGAGNIGTIVLVKDPELLTGDDYQIKMNIYEDLTYSYDLINKSKNQIISSNNLVSEILSFDGILISSIYPQFWDYNPELSINGVKQNYSYIPINDYSYENFKYPNDSYESGDDYLIKFTNKLSKALFDNDYRTITVGSNTAGMTSIDVPFEVWNINKNYRVNMLIQGGCCGQDSFILPEDEFTLYLLRSEYNSNLSTFLNENYQFEEGILGRVLNCNFQDMKVGDKIRLKYEEGLIDGTTFEFSTKYSKSLNSNDRKIKVDQNYPNPFNAFTSISFTLAEASIIKLVIYNSLGQQVQIVENSKLDKGAYLYTLNASKFASGTYIYRITSDFDVITKKMLLIK